MRAKYFRLFKTLGWGNDEQSVSIFNLLFSLSRQAKKGDIVLDLGAGECRYSFFFKNCIYLAMDFVQGDSKWDYSKLDFIADICKPYFIKSESVDYCLNTTTLEHLKEPSHFFIEVNRILKPGGMLYLYVPFVYHEHQAPYDYFRYTSYGLKYLVEKSGLNLISIKPSNRPLYTGIRWANITLKYAETKNLFYKFLLNGLKVIIKYLLIPVFDLLSDHTESVMMFPQCWILKAQKVGKKQKNEKNHRNKQYAIEYIFN